MIITDTCKKHNPEQIQKTVANGRPRTDDITNFVASVRHRQKALICPSFTSHLTSIVTGLVMFSRDEEDDFRLQYD